MKTVSKDKSNNFIVQGSILAIAGMIVRAIGLIYRIPLTNIIGDEGIGVYSTAFSIYNILFIISSYTLPQAISKLIAARLALNKYKNAYRCVIGAVIIATISGTLFGLICYFGAEPFSILMSMPQAKLSIETLAPTIFITAFLGVLRGYFQGYNNMVPTAVSQIIEQIVNAVVSIVAGYMLFNVGLSIDRDLGLSMYNSAAYGAAGGTIGTGAGALFALIFCIIAYFSQRKKFISKVCLDKNQNVERYSFILKVIMMTIFPMLISTTIFQVINLADQAVFAKYFQGDYSNIWGAYSGKYTLMINLPVSVASSLGMAVIPSMAASMEKGNRTSVVAKTGTAVRFNMVVAIPAAVGLAVLAKPIFDMLFTTDNKLASTMMIVGSFAVVFTAYSTILNSVLQGIGNIWVPVKNAIISFFAQLFLLVILLNAFNLGIYAVIIAGMFFYLLMSVLNFRSVHKRLDYKQEILKTFISPLFSSIVMGVVVYFSYTLFNKMLNNLFGVIISILLGLITYLVILLLTKGVDEVDLSRFPKSEALIKICKKFHLIKRY